MLDSDIDQAKQRSQNSIIVMKKTDNIFVAGHKGLVGSSVLNLLIEKGYKKIITVDRKKLDLRDFNKVK